MDTVKKNLIGSHQRHKEAKARQSVSVEPTKESSMASNAGKMSPTNNMALVFDKHKTFYSTTSSSRLRVVTSHFMTQNHFLAREINKNYKKLHFKAAQSVQMQHPGTLKSPEIQRESLEPTPIHEAPFLSTQSSKGFHKTQ